MIYSIVKSKDVVKITKEEIGAILKSLRLSAGKTQKEVAELIGRNQQIVGHWETGYSQPDANTLFELCSLYGTTVDRAFGFETETDQRRETFSPLECRIIKNYRTAGPAVQDACLRLLEIDPAEFSEPENEKRHA